MTERLRIKICGLARREDALLADELGADFLGVVLSSGFGRSVDAADARELVAGTRATKVAVLVDESAAAAQRLASELGAGVIQLHGDEDPALLEELRTRGDWRLWKSVRARSLEDITRVVERYRPFAHGILVEGWKEGVVGGGGASVTLDGGDVRKALPSELDFVLAGGMTPSNVGEAVALFRPTVVDVSSGVEAALREKDPGLVRDFISAARAAQQLLSRDPTALQ